MKKYYTCLETFTLGTKNPREIKKGRTYKFKTDVGKYYVRKGKLKQK